MSDTMKQDEQAVQKIPAGSSIADSRRRVCSLLFSLATNMPVVMFANVLIGLGLGIMTPFLIDTTAKSVVPKVRDTAFSIVVACVHLGSFLSPFAQQLIVFISKNPSQRFIFSFFGYAVLIAMVILAVVVIRKKEEVNVNA